MSLDVLLPSLLMAALGVLTSLDRNLHPERIAVLLAVLVLTARPAMAAAAATSHHHHHHSHKACVAASGGKRTVLTLSIDDYAIQHRDVNGGGVDGMEDDMADLPKRFIDG